jgi:phosphoribosylamine---glycine ligase
MNILVVGQGGREHALAWKALRCAGVERVLVAPGNAGTAREPGMENVAVAEDDFTALANVARRESVALTLVGPEAPLVAGIRDHFDAEGLPCFGPSAAAARLEGSKAFSKDFLARHGIPTGRHRTFTDLAEAEAYLRAEGAPIVVKADGLAAGKGVVVAREVDEALAAVRAMLSGDAFGGAGRRVVVEEFLDGEEASFICLSDGRMALPFASSQDHKPRDDGDQGPNTGGMGAYSPAPVVTPEVHERIMREVIVPTLAGMAADGHPYQGFLYAGLMIMPDGAPRVIEFNCRFGDPEAQPVMMRLRSDLVDVCRRAVGEGLDGVALDWDERVALGVVMAAGGYPNAYRSGDVIDGLDGVDADDLKVFHAGTRLEDGRVVTAGGRVLCVVGLGVDVAAAKNRAYQGVERIRWADCFYRRDIGHRAIARLRA